MIKEAVFSLALLALAGCVSAPQKGGSSRVRPAHAELQQSENPKDPSSQKTDFSAETILPAGTPIYFISPEGITNAVAVLPKDTPHRVTDKTETVLGAAQKDMAREVAAKLGSMRWVQFVGIGLFLFGIASAFWPPLKLIVGSVTTSAAAAAAGVFLVVLPSLVVGNEQLLLVLGVGALALLAAYWFAHRHAAHAAKAATLEKVLERKSK